MRIRPNGRPGEHELLLAWWQKLLLAAAGTLLAAIAIGGFVTWRDVGILKAEMLSLKVDQKAMQGALTDHMSAPSITRDEFESRMLLMRNSIDALATGKANEVGRSSQMVPWRNIPHR